MNFVVALLRHLKSWQDDIYWLTPDYLQMYLTRAAADSLPAELPRITLRRLVSPEPGLTTWTLIDLGDGDSFFLAADDVATLRALLLSWDEHAPARVGDGLMMPCKLEDGRVVSEVVQELLDEKEDDET